MFISRVIIRLQKLLVQLVGNKASSRNCWSSSPVKITFIIHSTEKHTIFYCVSKSSININSKFLLKSKFFLAKRSPKFHLAKKFFPNQELRKVLFLSSCSFSSPKVLLVLISRNHIPQKESLSLTPPVHQSCSGRSLSLPPLFIHSSSSRTWMLSIEV